MYMYIFKQYFQGKEKKGFSLFVYGVPRLFNISLLFTINLMSSYLNNKMLSLGIHSGYEYDVNIYA